MRICPECNSTKIVKIGFRIIRNPRPHKRQRVQCQRCGKTFYDEEQSVDIDIEVEQTISMCENFSYKFIRKMVKLRHGDKGVEVLNSALKRMRTSGKLKVISREPLTYKKT